MMVDERFLDCYPDIRAIIVANSALSAEIHKSFDWICQGYVGNTMR